MLAQFLGEKSPSDNASFMGAPGESSAELQERMELREILVNIANADEFSGLEVEKAPVGRTKVRKTKPQLAVNPTSKKNGNAIYAIGIKKIRRKKMNKHKKKKQRREVRDSTRYNKEKRKKSGPMREKQE
jgi:hypothetical protein